MIFRIIKFAIIAFIVVALLSYFGFLNDDGTKFYEDSKALLGKVAEIEVDGKLLQDYSLRELKDLTAEEIDSLVSSYKSVGLPLTIEEDLTDPAVYEKYSKILDMLDIDGDLPQTSEIVIIKKGEGGEIIFERVSQEDTEQ